MNGLEFFIAFVLFGAAAIIFARLTGAYMDKKKDEKVAIYGLITSAVSAGFIIVSVRYLDGVTPQDGGFSICVTIIVFVLAATAVMLSIITLCIALIAALLNPQFD